MILPLIQPEGVPIMKPCIFLHLPVAATLFALLSISLGGCVTTKSPDQATPGQEEWPTPSFADQTRAPQPAQPSQYSVEIVASGLVHPWSVAFLPDGRMLVTERPGRLRIIDQTGQLSEPLEGLPPIRAVASGAPMFPPVGLHDVVLDPEFSRNQRLYLSYLAPPAGQPSGAIAAEPYREWILRSAEGRERNPIGIPQVASARLSADGRRLEDVVVTLEGGHRRLVIAPDSTLYVTSSTPAGRGVPIDSLPQRLTSLEGKVLRINRDGSIPSD
jgi:aldose sugar dehydrogenase